ncbi:MAG: hypothetical protein OHK0037_35110 [Elainellaceae cyanobacterium]
MNYSFELVGISPVLSFFNHQHSVQQSTRSGAEYLGAYRCTLDAFLESVESVPPKRGWNLDAVVDSVVNFWLSNGEQVRHWRQRLEDAGRENVLVARVADVQAMQQEFESLLNRPLD